MYDAKYALLSTMRRLAITLAVLLPLASPVVMGCHFFNSNMVPGRWYTISSLGFPNPYPSYNHNCLYEATAPLNYKIYGYCDRFDVKWTDGCAYAALVFSPSGDPYYSDFQRYCGLYKWGEIRLESTGNKFLARFDNYYPNYYGHYQGFRCYIKSYFVGFTTTSPPTTTKTTTTTSTAAPTSKVTTAIPATNCECGAHNSISRIVGGIETEVNEYPNMAAIAKRSGGNVFCGASIISNKWLLTASHCVDQFEAKDLLIMMGDHNTQSTNETEAYNVFISEIIMHEKYDSNTVDNDIALLRLEINETFSTKQVSPVCLPFKFPTTEDFDGEEAIVLGWGVTSHMGDVSAVLNEVSLPVESTTKCKTHSEYTNKLTDNMFCTYKAGKDACQGDSGGPLMFKNTTRLYQIGIVSWGIECAIESQPGVYTKIVNYLDWIESKTKADFCKK